MNKMVSKSVSLLLVLVLCKGFVANNLTLEQVFIFSRHNIRYPLDGQLHTYSAKRWPLPAGPLGALTPRGAQQEGYMGEYFSEWFRKEQFLSEGCPDEDSVYVYADTSSRTKATARAFIDSVFKGCYVPVNHKNSAKPDPLFAPVIHNTTEEYKHWVIEEITRKLQNNYKLQSPLSKMNEILEIEGSVVCKRDGICDLNGPCNTISYLVGEEVLIRGPFFIGMTSMDAFTMSYYDGVPIQEIAWGKITTPEEWMLLTEIGRQDQYLRYTTVAEDIAQPLVQYMTTIFKNYDGLPQLMLLVGHDYNMNALATSLGFESIDLLPNQYEKYPIGGKYVFQRWTDNKRDYLKVEYVYPGFSQLRKGLRYSEENPPQVAVMRLKWCNTDEFGFCPWKEFVDKL